MPQILGYSNLEPFFCRLIFQLQQCYQINVRTRKESKFSKKPSNNFKICQNQTFYGTHNYRTYRIVASRSMSQIVTPHVTNWIISNMGCQKIKVVRSVRYSGYKLWCQVAGISKRSNDKQKSFFPKKNFSQKTLKTTTGDTFAEVCFGLKCHALNMRRN